MASGVIDEALADRPRPFVKIAGVCGETPQAISEARLAVDTGYHAGLLSLSAVARRTEPQLLEHCAAVAAEIPLVGFYLQPAVGGRVLSYRFWRSLAELESLVAIKIAPFNRYQTLDVVRAVIDAGRSDVALYTGNDDNIVVDLLTPFEFSGTTRWIVGGLLGQWGVWTRRAVELLDEIKTARGSDDAALAGWLSLNAEVTDANAAIFDAANRFAGCIPGIMEVLRRQGLTPSNRCLDPAETLSPGQSEGIDRVWLEHRHLTDDAFVQANLDRWLSP
jgi:dihydrodipicolinate synthase/N-acetylneuraminate lyase